LTVLLERCTTAGIALPPVIPMALQGLWGSYFSRVEGSAMSKPFRRGVFSAVTLNVGAPIAAQALDLKVLQATVEILKEGKL
jgi:hypothetical protein